jgi:thioredoxin-related protein
VTPIYVDARGQKQHKFQHNGEMMDVDTKTLVGIYNVTATPTLIFADSEASHIFVVPGYMPPKQFKATLEFVKQKKWKGKDRKNGEVYTALKAFYKEKGIEIKAEKR